METQFMTPVFSIVPRKTNSLVVQDGGSYFRILVETEAEKFCTQGTPQCFKHQITGGNRD